jgi:hypothetical protein
MEPEFSGWDITSTAKVKGSAADLPLQSRISTGFAVHSSEAALRSPCSLRKFLPASA